MTRLGIIGCGAVAEAYHLPAAISIPDLAVSVLVDRDVGRAMHLRKRFGLHCHAEADYKEAADAVDCVVNALPNRLHHTVTRYFLERGVPVLCEKPLATTFADAQDLVEVAETLDVPLAVGHIMRFQEVSQIIGELVTSKSLGPIESVEVSSGYADGWQSRSGYDLSIADMGGGILMSNGIHFLDLLLAWFGIPSRLAYLDDSWEGGMEANVEATFDFPGDEHDFRATLKLSRTDDLKNQTWIHGEAASIEAHDNNSESLFLHPHGVSERLRVEVTLRDGQRPRSTVSYFRDQLVNFLDAVHGNAPLRVSGASNLGTMKLIDECYAAREPMKEPWLLADPPPRARRR